VLPHWHRPEEFLEPAALDAVAKTLAPTPAPHFLLLWFAEDATTHERTVALVAFLRDSTGTITQHTLARTTHADAEFNVRNLVQILLAHGIGPGEQRMLTETDEVHRHYRYLAQSLDDWNIIANVMLDAGHPAVEESEPPASAASPERASSEANRRAAPPASPSAREAGAPAVEDAVMPWAWLVGGEAQARKLVTFSAEEEARFTQRDQPALLLIDLHQLTQDPLLALQLEAMRQRKYFAKQGGAVQLVIADATAQTAAEVTMHAKAVFTALNQEFQDEEGRPRVQLSWDEMVTAAIPGEVTSAAALGTALQGAGVAAPHETMLLHELSRRVDAAFAQEFLAAWGEAVPPGATMIPLLPFERTPRPAAEAATSTENRAPPAAHVTSPAPSLRAAIHLSATPPADRATTTITLATDYSLKTIRIEPMPIEKVSLCIPVPQPITATTEQDESLRGFQQRILAKSG